MGCDNMNHGNMNRGKDDGERMLRRIQELSFAMIETQLFLDSHSSNGRALDYFDQLKREYKETVELYEKLYGPLTPMGERNDAAWSWVTTPWPWELGFPEHGAAKSPIGADD